MSIDLSRWPDADELLDRALSLPSAERVAYVRAEAKDSTLAALIEAILAEADGDDGFLDPAGALTGSLAAAIRSDAEGAPPMLTPGSFVEHYEVMGPIGRGGMGEVYRARDTKLARDVALKVLPERYASDPERQSRFRREARVLASLNHTGIAAIYGVAESEGIEALVLELVEGQTLAEVLQAGPLPIDEAIRIARQLVEAVASAHERGILHRDLKPANIKLAPPATVKILDFGLARMLASADAADAAITLDSPHNLIGTAAYMSPEQARGRHVDERTDIWAFGCVLFEMLTGTRAFSGATVPDVLAAVIEREPAFSLLPTATPSPLRRLLRRCLEKDPQRRLGFIRDARLELDDATQAPVLEAAPQPPRARWPLALAGLVIGVLATIAAVMWSPWRETPRLPVSRLVMPLPAGDRPVTAFQPMVALSPDGRTLVYRARRGTTIQLFQRALDTLEPAPIPGTEGATSPFFSPDGRWLGFDADGVLKRVALAGGTPVVVCDAPGGVTASWLADDTIVFATNTSRVLHRVAASGGTATPLTALDSERGDTLHLLPQALPDSDAVLFTIVTGSGRQVAMADLASGDVTPLGEGTHARYLAGGYLVFAREGTLWASRFDPERRSLVGQALPLEERIAHTDNTVFHFATSAGSLVYLPPQSATSYQRLAWIDRDGRETAVPLEPGPYTRVSLAPDGSQIALAVEQEGNTDIWVADPSRDTMSRLTFEPTIETMPTWSPDGARIAFRSEREGPGVFQRNAQGSGPVERLSVTDGPIHSPYSWTPDGKTLLLAVFRSFRQQAIGSVTPPDVNVRILLDGNYAQMDPQISPDGRWLAYQSDETGRFEIYVRPYPDVDDGRWQISAGGGTSPRWARNGDELFYYDGTSLVGTRVSRAGASFLPGKPAPLFAVNPFGGRLGPDFEIAPDGRRFLFLLPGPDAPPSPAALVVVQNWIDELNARFAGTR